MRIDLTQHFQSMRTLTGPRTFVMEAPENFRNPPVVLIETGQSPTSTTGMQIAFLDAKNPRITIDDTSDLLRCTVAQGTVAAVYVEAEAAPDVVTFRCARIGWDKAADANAAAVTAHNIYVADRARTITAAHFIPDAGLVADDTHNATITATTYNLDGSVAGVAASITTSTTGAGGSGNWSAGVVVALNLGAVNLTAGQVVKVAIGKAGNGVVVPSGHLQIEAP
jgi:hypothetical protein